MPKYFKKRLVVSKEESRDGWYSRGYFPHFDGEGMTQHVCFHLFDSPPQHVLGKWREELKWLPTKEAEIEKRTRIQDFLDSGYGECFLSDDRLAEIVENALLHFDGERYALHAWCIMPNHTHTLFTPEAEFKMSKIVHSWKSFTANKCNEVLDARESFGSATRSTGTFVTNSIIATRLPTLKTIPSKPGCVKSPKTGGGAAHGGA